MMMMMIDVIATTVLTTMVPVMIGNTVIGAGTTVVVHCYCYCCHYLLLLLVFDIRRLLPFLVSTCDNDYFACCFCCWQWQCSYCYLYPVCYF